MAGMSRQELLRLARAGASARVKELRAELDTIYRTFPDMKSDGAARASSGTGGRTRKNSKKRRWTDADRKAVSERMKKYWAGRLGKTAKAAKTAKTAKAAR